MRLALPNPEVGVLLTLFNWLIGAEAAVELDRRLDALVMEEAAERERLAQERVEFKAAAAGAQLFVRAVKPRIIELAAGHDATQIETAAVQRMELG